MALDTTLYINREAAMNAFQAKRPIATAGTVRVLPGYHDTPGEVEVHANDGDITHILEGEAELVVGGEIVGGKTAAPGEVRGTGLRGGTIYKVKSGDLLLIPAGVPHWFKKVKTPVRYTVVKLPTSVPPAGRPDQSRK